ncbi:MAG: class I SAM-dependent methyltransferase [Anaerolineales bacterium]|nr:class I SAM-dependent methyltransferase [Anaerolineales bacterium]
MTNFSESRFAAWLQRIVSFRREDAGLYQEIAERLPLVDSERILDIGTGTGLQLKVIHDLAPHIDLFGLDLSAAAIQAASRALAGLKVDLRAGSISDTTYKDNYFDIVTCNASMSYWENPRDCFDEIFRILKPGGQVMLFEPHKEINIEAALDQIRENMADKCKLRRWGAVQLNKYGLKRGASIGLNLYYIDELRQIAAESRFGAHHSIKETSLMNIPIFVCIHLWKAVPSQ